MRLFLLPILAFLAACTPSSDAPAPAAAVRDVKITPPTPPATTAGLPTVTIDALLKRQSASVDDLQWHDGSHLLASVRLKGEERARARLIGLDGNLGEPLSQPAGSAAPDGSVRLTRDKEKWALVDVATGAVKTVPAAEDTRAFSGFRPAVWSRDSRFVAAAETYREVGSPKPTPTVVDGVSIIDKGAAAQSRHLNLSRITIVDRTQPTKPQRILIEGAVYDVEWSPDGQLYATKIVFAADDPYTEVLVFTPGNDTPRTLFHTLGRFQSMAPNISPDGRTLALAYDVDNRTWDDFTSLVMLDVQTGKETRITRDIPVLGSNLIWSHDGSEIYAGGRAGGLSQIWALPLKGEPRQLTSGPRRHFDMVLSADGQKLAYRTEDGYGRQDVRVLDLKTGAESVVFIVEEPARDFTLGEWRHIRWDSTDGVRPYGYVFLPPGFDANRKYPLFVDIHGGGPGSRLYLNGPITISVSGGPLEWHAWAALGYVLLVPDYRSTGDYGAAPITERRKSGAQSPQKDMDDAVTGVRHMIAQGYIDEKRVAVLGHSAGGPRAYNAVVSNPGLFAAAIINEGIPPDPISTTIGSLSGGLTGGSTMGMLEDNFAAPMAQAPERYNLNTMFDAARSKTPMLILMGEEQLGGSGLQPWEVVYSILNSQKVPARMLVFTEEGHNYTRPASARLAFNEIRTWLQKYAPAGDGAAAP